MQNEPQENFDEILKDQTTRIYDLYQNKSNNFQKNLRLLLGFALLFLFIILIPYVTITVLNDGMNERLQSLQEEMDQKSKILKTYQNVQSAIEGLQRKLKRGPMSLREFILSLPPVNLESQNIAQSNIAVQQMQSDQTSMELPNLNAGENWANIRIQQEVQRRFDDYKWTITEKILKPLQSLQNDAILVIDFATIKPGLDTLQAIFSTEIKQNPQFWITFQGKGETYNKLDKAVQRFWETNGFAIKEQSDLLEKEKPKLEKMKNELDSQLKELHIKETEIENRLKQIEFPFGKLPIGLNESIAVFPVLLAIGFVVLASSLRDTIRLRKNYHKLYQSKDPKQKILTDEQIMLIAPLWIDPLNIKNKNIFSFLILSIPFFIFIVSCSMIFYSWTIPGFLRFGELLNWWLYGGLYALGLLIFIYGYYLVSSAVKSYNEN